MIRFPDTLETQPRVRADPDRARLADLLLDRLELAARSLNAEVTPEQAAGLWATGVSRSRANADTA